MWKSKVLGGRFETLHQPIDEAKPGCLLAFHTAASEHLHTQADSQQRNVLAEHMLGQGHVKPALPQIAHSLRKCADARQDEVAGLLQILRAVCHERVPTALLDRAVDRIQVAHAVIEDRH
jgi:hypothetical protein